MRVMRKSARENRVWHLIALLLLVVAAAALRLWKLTDTRLWWDEGISVYLASLGWRGLTVGKDFLVDLHPPVYYLLLHLWTLATGYGEVAVRSLSILFGVITVPAMYAVGRQLWNAKTGLVAATLIAFWPLHIFHSQEARMYSLVPLLSLLILYSAARLTELDLGEAIEPSRTRAVLVWLAGTLVLIVSLYTYYYLAFLLLGATAWIAYTAWRARRFPKAWLSSVAVALLAFVPWMWLLWSRVIAVPGVGTNEVTLPLAAFLEQTWQTFAVAAERSVSMLTLLTVPFGAALVAGAVLFIREKDSGRRHGSLVLVVLGVAVAMNVGFLASYPFLRAARHMVYLLPLLLLIIARAIAAPRRSMAVVVLAAVLLTPAWMVYLSPWRVSWSDSSPQVQAMERLGRIAQDGDLTLIGYPWQAGLADAYSGRRLQFQGLWADSQTVQAQMAQTADSHTVAWLLEYSPRGAFDAPPATQFDPTFSHRLYVDQCGGARIVLYARPGTEAPDFLTAVPRLHFAQGLAISDYWLGGADSASCTAEEIPLPPNGPVPGRYIHVRLLVSSPPEGMDVNYQLFLHLTDEAGETIYSQADHAPARGSAPMVGWAPGEALVDHSWLEIPSSLAPGRYRVEVGFYNLASGDRLALVDPSNSSESAVLYTFEVR